MNEDHESTSMDEPTYHVVIRETDCSRGSSPGIRVAVLHANIILCLVCVFAGSYGMSARSPFVSANAGVLLQIVPTVLLLGPMLLLTVLAAWGPGHGVVRGVLFVIGIQIFAAVDVAIGYGLESLAIPHSSEVTLFLARMSNWLCPLASAAFCLAMVGSVGRLRIGPSKLPAVRATIFSIMVATSIVGVLISAKYAIDIANWEAEYAAMEGDGVSDDVRESVRANIISQFVLAGPLICLFLCLAAAAAFYWLARIAVVAASFAAGAFSYASTGPQPGMQATVQLITIAGTVMLVLAAIWVAVCIKLLDRSGWHCARRTTTPN